MMLGEIYPEPNSLTLQSMQNRIGARTYPLVWGDMTVHQYNGLSSSFDVC